jgi:ATP-dependent Clp protease protease subunit
MDKKIYLSKETPMGQLSVYTVGDKNVYLAGDISAESTSEVATKIMAAIMNTSAQVALLRDAEPGNINLFIQSGGGSIHDMWGLIDFMLTSPIPIYTYSVGLTASAALKIFLAGSVRFVMEHSTLMYHELAATNGGKLEDIYEWKDYLEKEQDKIDEYIRRRTLMKKKQIADIRAKKKDFYMGADEAIELGFATHKFEPKDWGCIIN